MWAGLSLQACGSQVEAGSYSKERGSDIGEEGLN